MNTKERAEIWKEYFDKLLYTGEPKVLIKIGNREINCPEEEECGPERGLLWRRGRRILLLVVVMLLLIVP
jgi:hypothetical protein